MNVRRVTRGIGALVVALLLPSMGFSLPAMADEANAGVLVVEPAVGDLDTPIDVSTVGLCERGTTFMVSVSGRGIEGDGDEIIVGATDLRWLEPTGYPSYLVSLGLTLDGFFNRADINRPQGEYVLTFICRNRLDVEPLQAFVAPVVIDKQGRYEAEGLSALSLPEALEKEGLDSVPIPGTDDAEVGDAQANGGVDTGGESSNDPYDEGERAQGDSGSPGGSGDGGGDSSGAPAEALVAQVGGAVTDGAVMRTMLLIFGMVLLLGAMAVWFLIHRRDSRNTADAQDLPPSPSLTT